MAAPLCKLQSRQQGTLLRVLNDIRFGIDINLDPHLRHVRFFNKNTQKLSSRKKNRNRKENDVFGDFLVSSFVKPKGKSNKLDKISSTQTDDQPQSQAQNLICSDPRPPPFIQLIRERYRQACRSVAVRTQNPEATVRALSSFGTLKFAHCVSSDQQYLLAEFASESCVKKLQEASLFFFENKKFPLMSRSLFDESRGGLAHDPRKRKGGAPLLSDSGWHSTSSPRLYPRMSNLDEELHALSESRTINDLDLRARFLACVMVEDLVRPLLPEARVIPYGSCLNGFGWWDSDLDMMLCLQGDPYVPGTIKKPRHFGLPTNFKFLTEVFPTERILAQKTLTMVAALLELGSRFNNVHKILNAHVPIVRFQAATLNLHCDVSLEAMDSIKMTELLYLYCSLDVRVRPLMSGIKQWALSRELTSSGEQQKPTTIGLLTLLVFYLQTRSPQVLPTLRTLQKAAAPSDMFYIDSVVYGIPSNPSILPKSANSESLESLLHGFFFFYSEFDFESQAISIIEGSTFPKPQESSPVYVENPLCIGLNICKNISARHLQTFQEAMRVAAWKIESLAAEPSSGSTGEQNSKLTSLCDTDTRDSRLSVLFNSDNVDTEESVSVEVSELFLDDSETGSELGDNGNTKVVDEVDDVKRNRMAEDTENPSLSVHSDIIEETVLERNQGSHSDQTCVGDSSSSQGKDNFTSQKDVERGLHKKS